MNYRHGKRNHPLYRVWDAMRQRCLNPNNHAYANYGGRGITIDPAWADFTNFWNWAKYRWRKGYEIDRIDNDQGYSPENCRFVSIRRNNNNRRSNVHIYAFGEQKTIADWARDVRCIVSYDVLQNRIKKGWQAEAALTTKVRGSL